MLANAQSPVIQFVVLVVQHMLNISATDQPIDRWH